MPPLSLNGAITRVVALAGVTGLVGGSILERLLADTSVATAHTLGRCEPGDTHPKLTPHVMDFAALPPLPPLDEVYLFIS